MNGFDQRLHVLGGRELRNAVPKVENMASIASTETIEDARRLGGNDLGRREEHRGVEIALQSDLCADPASCLTDIDRPVHA